MEPSRKSSLIVIGSLVAIAGSWTWIYFGFKAPKYNVGLHQRVGQVMAEQTAKVVGHKGRVVLLTIPIRGEPELRTQLDTFRRTLKQLGNYELKEREMDPKGQDKYGLGSGLSGRRFVRAVKKDLTADAVVSFIGAPKLSDEDAAELAKAPKFSAE